MTNGKVNVVTGTGYTLLKNVGYCLASRAASAVTRSRRIRIRFVSELVTEPGGTSSGLRVSPWDSVKLLLTSRGDTSRICAPIIRISSQVVGKPQVFCRFCVSAVVLANGALYTTTSLPERTCSSNRMAYPELKSSFGRSRMRRQRRIFG